VDTYLDDRTGADVTESISSGIRRRIMALILCSTLAVALAFGLSFYYALVANQSAVAQQIPELAEVAAKLKNILIINTLAFVAIIIASFFVLARIVTSRMFQPLGLLHRYLTTLASGRLPRPVEVSGEGAFAGIEDALRGAVAVIRDRERSELEKLAQSREAIGEVRAPSQVRAAIEEVIASKSTFLGMNEQIPAAQTEEMNERAARARELEEDPLFIKPR